MLLFLVYFVDLLQDVPALIEENNNPLFLQQNRSEQKYVLALDSTWYYVD